MSAAHISVEEAADRLGVHPNTVRGWCGAGRLAGAFKIGGTWVIPVEALKRAPAPTDTGRRVTASP